MEVESTGGWPFHRVKHTQRQEHKHIFNYFFFTFYNIKFTQLTKTIFFGVMCASHYDDFALFIEVTVCNTVH